LFCSIVTHGWSGSTAFAADAITIFHGSYFGDKLPINAETLFMIHWLRQAVWDLAGTGAEIGDVKF
jgi:hypothetical protein